MSKVNEVAVIPIPLAIELGCGYSAMIVQFFINVICVHKRLKRNFKEGRTWNYVTRAELCAQFPFLSPDQVKRLLHKLIKRGILQVKNFNKMPGDNTNWYSFVDEVKWGISKIEESTPGRYRPTPGEIARPPGEIARAIPLTNHRDTTCTNKVNDRTSVTLEKKAKSMESMANPKVRMNEDQRNVLNWLISQNIDTNMDTLSWWARSYPLSRLTSVYREALKRKPSSIGAYMQRLLKDQSPVESGRIELNAEYTTMFKELKEWNELNIFKKHAIATTPDGKEVEINFNMDTETFKSHLSQKYDSLHRDSNSFKFKLSSKYKWEDSASSD